VSEMRRKEAKAMKHGRTQGDRKNKEKRGTRGILLSKSPPFLRKSITGKKRRGMEVTHKDGLQDGGKKGAGCQKKRTKSCPGASRRKTLNGDKRGHSIVFERKKILGEIGD